MHDAKPVLTLLALCGCGLFWLGLHWGSMAPQVRRHRLVAIAGAEDARGLPPARLLDQAQWLAEHRLARLQGLSVLVGLSALVGLGEGLAWRHRDSLGGMRLRNWTLGLLSGALLPGVVGGLVLYPGSWAVPVVAAGGAVWSALTMFLLSSGRPAIP